MAVASNVDICNMALDHLGKPSITSLSEGSAEAQACLRQYDIARRMCLSRSPWTFARRLQRLSAVLSNNLSELWEYRYDLPNNALKVIKLVPYGEHPRANTSPLPMYLESGSLYTNLEDAMLLYVHDSTDTLSWSALFDDVVALFLAMRLAQTMTRRKSDTDKLQDLYRVALAEAIEVDAQQETGRYVFFDDGYVDARGATGRSSGPQTDGSTIWG